MNNETFQKKSIIMYAKKIREIQSNQIDPYIKLIEEQLLSLYPQLEHNEDNATNWAYDIINCSTNTEVIETLDRLEQIIEKEKSKNWVCCVCGKNTYNVDIDNLFGKDHISCVIGEDVKEKEQLESTNSVNKQLETLKVYIKQLEETISRLESHYDEPTN